MNKLLNELKKRILVIDGAMGTELMKKGVSPSDNFDLMNEKRPELVAAVHESYVKAGADIIETNTFGANRLKLGSRVEEINASGVKLARAAAGKKVFVCGSVGPLGKLLRPFGEISFDEAFEIFKEQIAALSHAGADCISIETISDIQEMRAALIAAKESAKIPVICSLTYDQNGLTIFGTPPEAAAVTLEALGADILSLNCSTGPKDMLKVAKRLLASTKLPVMVMPNAGMPEVIGEKTVYKMTPADFGKYAAQFIKLGVNIIGGCCGTTPDHIKNVKCQMSNVKKTEPRIHSQVQVKFSSRTKVVEAKGFLKIGERINPTGRKSLREEIKNGQFHSIREEAAAQTKAGADLLDINISVPQGNDVFNMQKAVELAASASPLPLSIDSPNIAALETGLKEFPGKALINSVNGKKESLEKVLPLAQKYGAAVIGLCLDDLGIPKTAAGKAKIAKKIIIAAKKAGIKEENIFIDTLVMSAAVNLDDSFETIKAIPLVKKGTKVKTILGVSNVSHGLPDRATLNGLYLQAARIKGLDAAILDPADNEIKKALRQKGRSAGKIYLQMRKEIERASKLPAKKIQPAAASKNPSLDNIRQAVVFGDEELIRALIEKSSGKIPPQTIIDRALIPAMEKIGEQFSRKEIFLPQVLSSARAMKAGFDACKTKIPQEKRQKRGIIVLATVFGDIHDIGKNIVKMMLENHGYGVVDLGKDVSAEKIVEAAKKYRPAAIALSALLTTTMLEMKKANQALKEAGLNIPIIVGGAVVTDDFARAIGARFGRDAAEAVKLCGLINGRNGYEK